MDNKDLCDYQIGGNAVGELKPFLVEIETIYRHNVVIWAEDAYKATVRAGELCDEEKIDAERNSYDGRYCSAVIMKNDASIEEYDQYE